MIWHPDVPNLPIKKPKKIEAIETMDKAFLDSLPPLEVQEMVDGAADAVAHACKRELKEATHEKCLEIVSVALTVTGSAIGGTVGNAMVAQADKAAKLATDQYFPE